MVHQQDDNGWRLITQPAHAWVSGQLARAWGREPFGEFAPREEVCLAAEQHDVGWTQWEANPTLNPETGYPYAFLEMPIDQHLAIWTGAARTVQTISRYAGLLVSMHVTWLYETFPRYNATGDERNAIRVFLERERAIQNQLVGELSRDARYAAFVTDSITRRNRRLVGVWDWISLLLCQGLREEQTVENVPTGDSRSSITLRPHPADADRVIVTPWPFHSSTVTLITEARRITQRSDDENAMRAALANAETFAVEWHLLPNEQIDVS